MRNEYPRPDFIREKWMPLNGTWNFQDGTDKTPVKIQVPFPPQSRLSGFQKELTSDRITYQRNFFIPAEWIGQRILLHFGAVDYKCSVFINDHCVGFHEGGQSSFTFDITDFLSGGEETLTVAVTDYLHDETVPRGKQFWKSSGEFIWYTQSSGIWQSVWLEPVNEAHLEWIHFTPDIDQGTVEITYSLSDCTVFPCELEWDIRFKNNPVSHGSLTVSEKRGKIIVDIFKNKALRGSFHFTGWYWSPEHPNLFTVSALLKSRNILLDQVETYFGMRKVHVHGGRVYLNNQPYYQKLLLDQGYWPDGLYTAPSDEALIYDIQTMKNLGFNMIRKHVKVETARWYYHCDRLGMIVWQDMVNGGTYNAPFMTWLPALFPKFKLHTSDRIHPLFGRKNVHGREEFIRECKETVTALKAFPCISTWVIFNEGWGQFDTNRITKLVRKADKTRLIDQASGWFDQGMGDIKSIHNYFFPLRLFDLRLL